MKTVAFVLALIALAVSIFTFGVTVLDDSLPHPFLKMEARYDEESKTIFWKGTGYKESPLGTIHLECPCGHHTDKWDPNAVG